jgi:hypothetical protein
VSRKWVIVTAVVVAALIIAIAVVAIVLDRERDEARRAAATAATSTTGISSPYDFVELPDDEDLDAVEAASLVSILVADEDGKLTSYGVSTGLPAARALSDAVRDAQEVDAETVSEMSGPGSTSAEGAGGDADSTASATITFVLPSREILTFLADLDTGLLARGDSAWQIDGDLRALVEAAISSPG